MLAEARRSQEPRQIVKSISERLRGFEIDPFAAWLSQTFLEIALADLPEARCSEVAAARLRHGNPAEVIATEAEFGDEAWASHQGRAVAVGIYRAGMLHPSRVFLT